jgi:hypothetical protein
MTFLTGGVTHATLMPMTTQLPVGTVGESRERVLTPDRVARMAVAAGCAATVAGALVGGVLGRLAMSLLASRNPEDAGFTSDDGFTIGQVTAGGTTQLVFASIALAMVGASVYMIVRPLLLGVGAVRVAVASLGFGVTAAALLIDPEGFDFSQLEPPWLPVALFVVLPVALVAVFSTLVERFLADGSWFLSAPRRKVLPLLAIWLASGFGIVVVVPIFLVTLLLVAFVRLDVKPAVLAVARWSGRAAMVAIAAAGTWNLAADISTIV